MFGRHEGVAIGIQVAVLHTVRRVDVGVLQSLEEVAAQLGVVRAAPRHAQIVHEGAFVMVRLRCWYFVRQCGSVRAVCQYLGQRGHASGGHL